MEKRNKIPGWVWLGALAAGLIPYRAKRDKETGAFDLGSLLWSVKKTPGEESDTYAFELLPLLGGRTFIFFLWKFTRERKKTISFTGSKAGEG